jgi:hypothetical protein
MLIKMKNLKSTAVGVTALLSALTTTAYGAPIADVAVLIDESGSMSGEQAWIGGAVTALEAALIAAGVGGGSADQNQYALVGFGSNTSGQTLGVGIGTSGRNNNQWLSATDFQTADNFLRASGSFEDGYSAINFFLGNYTPRTGSALNIILITDEDRDNGNINLTYDNILGSLQDRNALLNVVVSATFRQSGSASNLIGVDSTNTGYKADGSGSYTSVSDASAISGAGTTINDYVNLALATGGAAWDLNQLRAGGNTAISFTAAFTDIKVTEIQEQIDEGTVPIPGTLVLVVAGLIGVGVSKRANPHKAK